MFFLRQIDQIELLQAFEKKLNKTELANGLLHGPLDAKQFVGLRVLRRIFVRIDPNLFIVIKSTINSS